MTVELITREDLQSFRSELLNDLKKTFSQHLPEKPKQWLKSSEVRRMLKVSPGTLQNLRINGTLRYTKIGGTMYYSHDDIEAMLDAGMKETNLHSPSPRGEGCPDKAGPDEAKESRVRPTLRAL